MNDFIGIDHSRLRSENVSVWAAKRRAKNHEDKAVLPRTGELLELRIKEVMC